MSPSAIFSPLGRDWYGPDPARRVGAMLTGAAEHMNHSSDRGSARCGLDQSWLERFLAP
jgi:hypothetical protein